MVKELDINKMVSAVLSNPKGVEKYHKIRIFKNQDGSKSFYFEFFTKTQSFHKTLSNKESQTFLEEHVGIVYKNSVITTEKETITILSNKKGKITTLKKPISSVTTTVKSSQNKQKKYILQEGVPIPFLIHLGVMTEQGKVVASKYDKFKQINRFLEFVDDILPKDDIFPDVYNVLDFGCGKSYLTFALYYFLVVIKQKKAHIVGIDLKEDVITDCMALAKKWNYEGLEFKIGRIEDYEANNKSQLDLIITLHACDTATDYALFYAIKNSAKAILSVPCCQHEINAKISKTVPNKGFDALLKYGIVKERFASLATDVMRAELLESNGYTVQLMEFIAMEHTAKNLLIRAVKKETTEKILKNDLYNNLCESLGVKNTLDLLLNK